ncbi:hypothetical protein [Nonomuraea glycinis]|uniref:hypothetical protein n=1 Tax=Nonomuraea glycinis TaxID=2047744 RepID=UPI0033BA5EE1
MLTVAQLVAAAGLHRDQPIKLLPGITWHVTRPLAQAQPPIITIGDLSGVSDEELQEVPGFGKRRLDALKTALAQAKTHADPIH